MGEAAVVGLVLSGIGAVGSYVAQKEAASEQKKAQKAQEKAAAAADAKQRIQAVREARIRRAEILSSAGNSGMGTAGASVAGATSSVTSQLGGNLSYMNTMKYFGNKASEANQAALDAGSMAANFQMIGKVGGYLGGEDAWKKVFNPGGIPQYPGAPIEDRSFNK